MNFLLLSVVLSFVGGIAFYFFGEVGAMSANASMLLSFEGLIIGAVLVRLNRDIPTVDWKSVPPQPIARLLDRLEDVAKVYIVIVTSAMLSICILLLSLYLDKVSFTNKSVVSAIITTLFGMLLGFIVSRMAFVVWLDLDIVRLQRAVILSAAKVQDTSKQVDAAEEKLASIKAARITSL